MTTSDTRRIPGPSEPVDFDPFAGPAIQSVVPSTEAQREIWTAVQMGQDASCAYNEGASLALEGALNYEALTRALLALSQRHESLRSTFSADGTSLIVSPELPPTITMRDCSSLSEREATAVVEEVLTTEAETPFDLERGPLLRVVVIRFSDTRATIRFTAHHIICDGWSIGVLLRELGILYTAEVTHTAPPLTEAPRFADYAGQLVRNSNSPEVRAAHAYWRTLFSAGAQPLDLQHDNPRPAKRTYASRRIDHSLDPVLVQRVKTMGAKVGASFFTTLLCCFQTFLHRLSGQEEIIVGIPSAGQSSSGLVGLVGHCVNLLPIRSTNVGEKPFSDHLKEARKSVLDAYDHQQCTFGSILTTISVERNPARPSFVQALFNLDQAIDGSKLAFEGLRVTYHSNPRHFENFEIFMNASEYGGKVVLETQYNTGLFSEELMAHHLRCFEQFLRSAVDAPTAPLKQLPLVAAQDLDLTLREWNKTDKDFGSVLPLTERFTAQAKKRGGAISVSDADGHYTYRELELHSNRLAHLLRTRGVTPGTLVGISLNRNRELLVALLGILKAGGAYVPLDPSYPDERIAYMASDAAVRFIVTESSLVSKFKDPGYATVVLDTERDTISQESSEPLALDLQPESPAYVIYTSGSTGKPKGVIVPHRAVFNFLESVSRRPGITSDDCICALTTISFDISVLELFLPLMVGARVVILGKEVTTDPQALSAAISTHGVTMIQATPSSWRLLLSSGWAGKKSLTALAGGEPLSRDLVSDLLPRVDALWNMYGPTETTVWSTCEEIVSKDLPITIGTPLHNTTCYVVDDRGAPVPWGSPGELLIGGSGVTLGYLGRPELTRERFISNPFGPGVLYRTGDRARFLPDGRLQHLGRNDTQIKVRGHRIEAGEIESTLMGAPGMVECAVIVREDVPGDQRLVAYVAQNSSSHADTEHLFKILRASLPEYMIPQHIVPLSRLPKTANGKLDRKGLPQPTTTFSGLSSQYEEPTTDREKRVALMFQEAVGIQRLSVTQDFFAVGGHSLLATQILARIRSELGVQVSLRTFFENATIRKLAAHIDSQKSGSESTASTSQGIPRAAGSNANPLSLMQRRLLYIEHLTPGTTVYNLPAAFRFKDPIDVSALEAALNDIVRRHDTLRTTYIEKDNGQLQVVRPELTMPLTVIDLSSTQDPVTEAHSVLDELARQTFDLTNGPLCIWKLVRISPTDTVLFFMAHHSVFDGWSFDIFLDELSAFYKAHTTGTAVNLPELPIRYADYALWHDAWAKGENLTRELAYWKNQLSGELPTLELPTDYPRPAVMNFNGDAVSFDLTPGEIEALTALGRREGATLFMVLLAAFKVLLFRYTGQEDTIVGTPLRGRSHAETQNLIGFFVNTLVLRTPVRGDLRFNTFLRKVREVSLDAFAHQDMPFDVLVNELNASRDLSRSALFQAFFIFQDVTNRAFTLGDIPIHQINIHSHAAPTDIMLWVKVGKKGLAGAVEYDSDLFQRETIEHFVKSYKAILASIASDPGKAINELAAMPEETYRTVVQSWNATPRNYDRNTSFVNKIIKRGEESPDAHAVKSAEGAMTYAELLTAARQIAGALAAQGAKPGVIVGIALTPTLDLPAAVLGILLTGAGYLPLDPNYPDDRISYMLSDSKAQILLSSQKIVSDSPALKASGATVITLEEIRTRPEQNHPSFGFNPEAPAYLIYTSGSTGRPKGVLVPYRAVHNFLTAMAHEPGIKESDTVLALTTLSFDISVLELILPLFVGGTVAVASREAAGDGILLQRAIDDFNVTVVQATPSTWRILLESGWKGATHLKALSGGEALPREVARELLPKVNQLWNMYGPTETTVWSCCARITDSTQPIVVGHPIANTEVYVVDGSGTPVPLGGRGEILIGGDGVTNGYWDRPDLTKERFVPNFITGKGTLYRTGDLGRWRSDGTLECLGRTDFQVKVRGHRIELGEIETCFLSHPSVREGAVVVREDRPGDQRIVAYGVLAAGKGLTITELRKHLRGTLPEYMIPQHLVEVDRIPRTANGKLDRKALPPPFITSEVTFEPPESENEKRIARIWGSALNSTTIGKRDNFFALGGHSLLSMQVIAQIERETGSRLSPRSMLLNSLEQVAKELPDKLPETPAPKGSFVGKIRSLFSNR